MLFPRWACSIIHSGKVIFYRGLVDMDMNRKDNLRAEQSRAEQSRAEQSRADRITLSFFSYLNTGKVTGVSCPWITAGGIRLFSLL